MDKLELAMKVFEAIMSLSFILGGLVTWNIGLWKDDRERKIYGLVMVLFAYVVFHH